MEELEKILKEKGMKVVFGLEAQGHIPTIEAELKRWNDSEIDMTYSKHVWEGIGKIIGWCPFTAALSYFEYRNKQNTTLHSELEKANQQLEVGANQYALVVVELEKARELLKKVIDCRGLIYSAPFLEEDIDTFLNI